MRYVNIPFYYIKQDEQHATPIETTIQKAQ